MEERNILQVIHINKLYESLILHAFMAMHILKYICIVRNGLDTSHDNI